MIHVLYIRMMITGVTARLINDILDLVENNRIIEILDSPNPRVSLAILIGLIKSKEILRYLPHHTSILSECALDELSIMFSAYFNVIVRSTDFAESKKIEMDLYTIVTDLKHLLFIA
jgi:hypothetical protein